MQPVESRIKPPAIALAIIGGLNLLGGLVDLCFSILTWLNPEAAQIDLEQYISDREVRQGVEHAIQAIQGPIGVATSAAQLIVSAFVLLAAIQMGRMRSWSLAVAASAAAILPCLMPCCCCLVNVAIGIWCLIVLFQADVRAAFAAGGPGGTSGPIATSSSS